MPTNWILTDDARQPCSNEVFYVHHATYGTKLAIYTEADWEDKSKWVPDWHCDFEFIRPRYGWAAKQPDGQLAMLDPQPTHLWPDTPVRTADTIKREYQAYAAANTPT